MIHIKRVYDPPEPKDGVRVLVDRVWPRGLSKERAQVNQWLRDIAPSDELRKWFSHDLTRWEEFRRRYRKELKGKGKGLRSLMEMERERGTVTLLFAAADREHNNAVALKEILKKNVKVTLPD